MEKYGVVNEQTGCGVCGNPSTTSFRGEPRCAKHAATPDISTKTAQAQEDKAVPPARRSYGAHKHRFNIRNGEG